MSKFILSFITLVSYFAFGMGSLEAREIYAPDATVRTASAIENQLGHQGAYHDEESDLVYKRARYYSPEKGRFIGRDPLEYVDGKNLYQFVRSKALNFADPSGLATCSNCPALPAPSSYTKHSTISWRSNLGFTAWGASGMLNYSSRYRWYSSLGDEASMDNCKGKTTADLWLEYSQLTGHSVTTSLTITGGGGGELGNGKSKLAASIQAAVGWSVTDSSAKSKKVRAKFPVLPHHEKMIKAWQAGEEITITGTMSVASQTTSLGGAVTEPNATVNTKIIIWTSKYHFEVVYDRLCPGYAPVVADTGPCDEDSINIIDGDYDGSGADADIP